MYPLTIGSFIQDRRLASEVEAALRDQPFRNVLDENEIGDWGAFLERLDALRPDVFIVEVNSIQEKAEDVVRRIRGTAARPLVVVIDNEMKPDRILEVMRAGAAEYLYPPLAEGLVRSLEGIAHDFGVTKGYGAGGTSVGIFSAKGGCGGTTVCCHLAAELASVSKSKTLLADMDLQGGLVGFLMKAKSEYSILDLTRNLYRLDESYWQGVISNGLPGLSIIKAPDSARGGDNTSPDEIRQILRFAKTMYPWTVADLGSGLSPLAVGVLEDFDRVFMVVTLEITALHRAKQIARELLSSGFAREKLGVVLNRAPKSPELTNDELESMLGVKVVKTIPNDYPTLYDAYAERKLAAEKSHIRGEFRRFAAKLAGVELKKKKFSFF